MRVPRPPRRATPEPHALRLDRDQLGGRLPFLLADGVAALVILSAYFDESAQETGDEPICIGGYIFKPRAYARFVRDWQEFLKTHHITHLHMTDLYAAGGEFKGMKAEKGPLFGAAVDLIRKHAEAGVAVLFDQKEFETEAPPEFARRQGSIYSTACQVALRASAVLLAELGYAHQLVSYTFDGGYEFESEFGAIMSRIAKFQDAGKLYRYHSHAFGEMKETAGLQAADVLAWTVAKISSDFKVNLSMKAFQPHMLRLAHDGQSRRRHTVHVFKGEMLRRFFAEQTDRPADYYFERPKEMKGRLR